MAWPNIEQRRERVALLLRDGPFNEAIRRTLAAEFRCSTQAIRADEIALNRNGALIYLSARIRKIIHARDGTTCQYCGEVDRPNLIVEHVIPAAFGGVAQPYNLVIACQSCNSKKGRRVWMPRNLEAITAGHPEWFQRVVEEHKALSRQKRDT